MSKFLDVSALFLIPKIIWVNLIQTRMKAFFGYFSSSKTYRVFNKYSLNVEEIMHVSFNETNSHISKIIKDAHILNSDRIDPTIRIPAGRIRIPAGRI